jgi:hypothetical protein
MRKQRPRGELELPEVKEQNRGEDSGICILLTPVLFSLLHTTSVYTP